MKLIRKLSTPIVIGAFIVSAITGVLMFFHLSSGFNKLAHEWLGLVFVGAGLLHIWKNMNAFKVTLKQPIVKILAISGVAIMALSFMPSAQNKKRKDPDAMIAFMGSATIDKLAEIAGKDSTEIIERLKAVGVEDVDGSAKLNGLTGGKARETIGLINQIIQ